MVILIAIVFTAVLASAITYLLLRVFWTKRQSDEPPRIAIGAGVGAVVGLVTGSLLVCLAIGTVAGLALRMKQRG